MANKLEPIYQTGVKFYSSLTRDLALGKVAIGKDSNNNDTFVEPGSICFVSDTLGNSIFLNNLLFGDGAKSSEGSTGTITEVTLSNIKVGDKTLLDYFDNNGGFISNNIIIKGESDNGYIELTDTEITLYDGENSYSFITEANINLIISNLMDDYYSKEEITKIINNNVDSLKEYINNKTSSVYSYKGSVNNYSDLPTSANPGDVYNVLNSYNNYPAGTNYAWVETTYNSSGSIKEQAHWDPLGGKFDTDTLSTELKNYTDGKIGTLKDELNSKIEQSQNSSNTKIEQISQSVTNLTNNINSLLTSVNNNKANIESNTINITNIATQLTWQ